MEIGLGPKLCTSWGEDREVVGERGGQSRGSQLVSGPLGQQNLVSSCELIMWEESPLRLKCGPNSLELTQASQVKGMVLHKTALSSETSSQSRGPQTTLIFDQLATHLGVPTTPSCSLIHRNNRILFCYGKRIQIGRLRFWEGPSVWASLSHLSGNRSCHPPSTSMCHDTLEYGQPGNRPQDLESWSFYWGFIMYASRNGPLAMWLILSSDPLYESQTESVWLTSTAF